MRPKDFKRWRKSLGLSQKGAAENLGLKRRVVQYYEKGERDGKDVDIPKSVRLACYALTEGVSDYHGPREPGREHDEPALPLMRARAARGADRTDMRLSLVHPADEAPPSSPPGKGKPAQRRKSAKPDARSAGKSSARPSKAPGKSRPQKPKGKAAVPGET